MSESNSKIVYAALSRMSEDRDVIKRALLHWRERLGDQPKVNVIDSVELIEGFLGLSTAEKKVLMMSMHAASSKAESKLSPVPGYILESGNDASTSAESSETPKAPVKGKVPHLVLTEGYVAEILERARRRDGASATELEEILVSEGLPELPNALNKAIMHMRDAELDLPDDASQDDCKTLCHELYMLVCDVMGPVVADDISYKAIASLLETPEASRYDPRQLI